jgi:hypothetical protein
VGGFLQCAQRQQPALYEFSTNFYIQFVKTNNSLLIVTWDEDDGTSSNHIPTIFFGMPVKQVSLARPLTSKRFASTGSLGR